MAARCWRKRLLVITGSTAGRGPCDGCGAVAELHEAREVSRGGRLVDVCLLCAARPARIELVAEAA